MSALDLLVDDDPEPPTMAASELSYYAWLSRNRAAEVRQVEAFMAGDFVGYCDVLNELRRQADAGAAFEVAPHLERSGVFRRLFFGLHPDHLSRQ
jgi:hypothetical protein